jgi:ABC-2 type transport system permease protein
MRLRSILLVARREILERGRSRGFLLSVLFTTTIVIGSFLIPALLFSGPQTTRLGLVEPAPTGLDASLQATASALDTTFEITRYPGAQQADAALQAGSVTATVQVPADLSSAGTITYKSREDPTVTQAVTVAVRSLRTASTLRDAGVDPQILVPAAQPPTVSTLEPQDANQESSFLFANIGAVLILIGVFSFGFSVLTGVVEEKQSRVVEVILSTVRPRDLLMGKVLGIGVLGIFQLIVFVLAGVIAAQLTDRFELPATTPLAVAMLVIWFILGYALYSTTLGFLGALASRTEEASNASTPVTIIAMLSYFASIFVVVDDPSGTVATILTFLPPAAPFVVPLRAALDAIPAWQIGLSIVLTVIAIWALFTIGARVYAGAILQTGSRMRLRDAWRAAQQQ